MTEIKWQHVNAPETKVIQIEQDTPLGNYTDILIPSAIAIHAGKLRLRLTHWIYYNKG